MLLIIHMLSGIKSHTLTSEKQNNENSSADLTRTENKTTINSTKSEKFTKELK